MTLETSTKAGICAVLGEGGKTVGTGFLAGVQHVCTCAHVVRLAVGTAGTEEPIPEGTEVTLEFEFADVKLQGSVTAFGDKGSPSDDSALLEIPEGALQGILPLKLGDTSNLNNAQFETFGYPRGWEHGQFSAGVIRDQLPDGRIQVEGTTSTGSRISPGYSGAPVVTDGRVVGVLVVADKDEHTKLALAIPSSALHALGLEAEIEVSNPSTGQRYAGRLRGALEQSYPLPVPMLDVPARMSGERGSGDSEASQLLRDVLAESSRVTLHAPAGGGKSGVVARLARDGLDAGDIPVVLDLKGWTGEMSAALAATIGSPDGALDAALRASVTDIDAVTFHRLTKEARVLLIADGLNEVSGDDGVLRQIVTVLDDAVRADPDLINALTTDRAKISAIAQLTQKRWLSADLLALQADDVETSIDKRFGAGAFAALSKPSQELICSPYFFHQATATGHPDLGSRLEALHAFFKAEVHLSNDEMKELGKFFLAALEKFGSYSMPAEWFEGEVEDTVREKLMSSGALTRRDEFLQMEHQLKQDFLISTWLAKDSDLWTPENFDLTTFESRSTDVLGLTIGQLSQAEGDQFLADVYDWNYHAALGCLSMMGSPGAQEAASNEMTTFLLAVTTEKLWDPVRRSRERTLALLEGQGEAANPYIRCQDRGLDQLIEVVRDLKSDLEWFVEWRDLFSIRGQPVTELTVQRLQDRDGRVGWTIANVLRRFKLTDPQLAQIRAILQVLAGRKSRRDATVRWRCVHVLGSSDGQENIEALLGGLADSDRLVKYGSIRALVEVASRSKDAARRAIFDGIMGQLESLPPRVLEEWGYCIFIKSMPEGWERDVTPVLEAVLASRGSEAEKEQWETLMAEFRDYASKPPSNVRASE